MLPLYTLDITQQFYDLRLQILRLFFRCLGETEEMRQEYLSQEIKALTAMQKFPAFPKYYGHVQNLPGQPITSFMQEFLGNTNTMNSTTLAEICRRQCVTPNIKDVTMLKVGLWDISGSFFLKFSSCSPY